MKDFIFRIVPFCVAIMILLNVSGCSDEALHRHYYALDIEHRVASTPQASPVRLEVRQFTVDSAYASKELVYRQGPLTYQIDYYHAFVVAPGRMITEKTRTWLMQSGLVTRVLDPGSLCVPTHCLEGNITDLYGDFQDKNAPAAVVAMRVFLIEAKTPGETILLGKTYESRVPLKTFDAPGLMAGYSAAVEQILTQLENDLSKVLPEA